MSLDGARPETNDAIRGPGHVRPHPRRASRLLAGRQLSRLQSQHGGHAAERRPRWAISTGLARRYGAKTRLSRFRPSGGGCHTWEDYRLTREQLAELSAFLGDHPEILTGDSFFALTPDSRRDLGLNMCGAAKMTCAVAPDGSVYPCAFLSDPAFLAGNVTRELARRHLRVVAGRSSVSATLEVEACRGCDRFSVCHGGCPAVGYFLTESMGLPDPECLRAVVPAPHGRRFGQGGGVVHAVPQPVQPSADRAGDGTQPHLVLGPPDEPGGERAAQRAAHRLSGGAGARRGRAHHHRGAVGPPDRPGLRAPHRGVPSAR